MGRGIAIDILGVPIDHQAPAFLRIAVAGGQGDPGHGANTGQGLAAKTERTHGLEVLEPGDLAGGVARYGQGELVLGDARAIVPNPEAPYAPSSSSTSMRVAPASIAFSTSSFSTDAGRSTTSPAAIWFASCGGNRAMGTA